MSLREVLLETLMAEYGGEESDWTAMRSLAVLEKAIRAEFEEPSTMPGFRPGLERALHVARTGVGVAGVKQPACTVCLVIDHALPGAAREALVVSAAGRLSVRALHQALRDVGLGVSREAISTHRNEAHQP